MIEAFSLATAHLFGDALASQAKLRYRVFVEHRRLDHPAYDGLEYDQFDTPGAVYFVWRDDASVVRGLLRLLPTTIPYMLQTHWPHLVADGDLPRRHGIREVTRICVDRKIDPKVRSRVFPELLCALQEYCALNAIEAVVGVTRPHLIETYIRDGITWLGECDEIEGELERAFRVPVEHMRPLHHCRKLGLSGAVLTLVPVQAEREAA